MFSAFRKTVVSLGAAALALSAQLAAPVQAAYVVTMLQILTDAVATGSGTINLAGLIFSLPTGSLPK
jgi:hypothetical protein